MKDWYQRFDDVENLSLDLNLKQNCEIAAEGSQGIYNLAANMGGMRFIEKNKALCMLSVLINTHMLQAAVKHKVPHAHGALSQGLRPVGYVIRRQGESTRGHLPEGD